MITGASGGIGAALALELARAGAKVGLCARRGEKLEEVADAVRSAGGEAYVAATDVSDRQQAENATRAVIDHFGGIDILVNNAGRGNLASVEDTSDEQLESMFALNVYALWYTTGVALPVMRKQGRGHIINIASVAGKMAFPFNSAYVAAKHACVGFTAALRSELIGSGVDATVICPAGVSTEWAGQTEGGDFGALFASGMRRSREVAARLDQGLAPLAPMMSAKEIALIIAECIRQPPAGDVFTHPGTQEQAIAAATNRREIEQMFAPLYIGMREAYDQVKPFS